MPERTTTEQTGASTGFAYEVVGPQAVLNGSRNRLLISCSSNRYGVEPAVDLLEVACARVVAHVDTPRGRNR